MQRILVTGGAGFIGSAVIRQFLAETDAVVINVDKLTYAANLEALQAARAYSSFFFEQADVCDAGAIAAILAKHRPNAILHLAAESHVDRSIDGPEQFVQTNVVGTMRLLGCATNYWLSLGTRGRQEFRFIHVSTDEVFGSLGGEGRFTEETAYNPRSPYSASKAASDHLARAWHATFGLPVVVTNCSNNYGRYQFPEKLIPLMILKGLSGAPLPVYGDGSNVRDWLHVDDHARALRMVLEKGKVNETYNIGGHGERTNLEVVTAICRLLNEMRPTADPYERLITYVPDRPGHDHRYAIDATKITREVGWQPLETFETGLRHTVRWYLENETWWRQVAESRYLGQRLGLRPSNTDSVVSPS